MADDQQHLRWAGVVAVVGHAARRGFEIDVHLPGHDTPEPVVLTHADAADLHKLLGDALTGTGEFADEPPGDDWPRLRIVRP